LVPSQHSANIDLKYLIFNIKTKQLN